MRPKRISKVLSAAKASALRRRWAREGLSVVFTNGVFDLLHAGHVDLLEKAARLGDKLIVGLNTDASARRLGKKGPTRPVNALKDRARVLESLGCVDAVVPFGEVTFCLKVAASSGDWNRSSPAPSTEPCCWPRRAFTTPAA